MYRLPLQLLAARLTSLAMILVLSQAFLGRAAGTISSSSFTLSDSAKPGACEAIWAARSIIYNPGPVAPRYSSEAACVRSSGEHVLFTVVNRKTGRHNDPNTKAAPDGSGLIEVDKTIGSVVKSTWNSGTGKWVKSEETLFSETLYIGGITAASDCSTLAFIATRPPTACGHAYTDVKTALAPCENADHDLVAHGKGAWTGDTQQVKDLGWTNPAGYCFEDSWLNDDIHGPKGAQRRWPVGISSPVINHLWLYEWTGSAAQVGGAPSVAGSQSGKYLVSKMGPLDNWGKMELAFGSNDGTHGTYAFSATTTCCCGGHVADSFFVIARGANHAEWGFVDNRSLPWATGTGHTINNRMVYNPASKRYLRWVTTDNFDSNVNGGCNNTEGQDWGIWYGSLGRPLSGSGSRFGKPWSNGDKGCQNYGAGYAMIDGDARQQVDRYVYGFNLARQYMTKGTFATLVPLDDGGFLGVLNGEPNNYPKGATKINNLGWYPKDPPTSIGLVRFDSLGRVVRYDGTTCEIDPGHYGGSRSYSASGLGYGSSKGNTCVRWVRCDPRHYLSHPILAALGADRFVLGWSEMIPTEYMLTDFTGNSPRGENNRNWDPDQEWPIAHYLRVPHAFYVAEINTKGDLLTDPMKLSDAGWGEFNNMVSMGSGRVAWTYIPNPTIEHVRPAPAHESSTVKNQKASSPACAKDSGGHLEQSGSFMTLQTTVYTQQAGTPAVQPSQCVAPADGQPVCSRLSPALRNSSFGCGGPGGWEYSNNKCSTEVLSRLKGGATDDGSRGSCAGQDPQVPAGTANSGAKTRIRAGLFFLAIVAMVESSFL